eukprot:4106601-Pyramimonas_sp.AAC.1
MQGLSSQLQKRVYMHHLGMDGNKPPGAWRHRDFGWNSTVGSTAAMLDPVNRGGGFDIIVDDAGH